MARLQQLLMWRRYTIFTVLLAVNVILLRSERHSLHFLLQALDGSHKNGEEKANHQNSSSSSISDDRGSQGNGDSRQSSSTAPIGYELPRNIAQTRTETESTTTTLIPLTSATDTETNDHWPPLEDLVDLYDDSISGIKSNVSFLLDIAILGHAKCATTFLVEWLQQHNETALFDREVCDLYDQKPAKLVRRIYQELAQPSATTTTTTPSLLLRGFKCPGHFSRTSLRQLVALFPNTKIMIGLRHPVRYFESYYNFRARHPQRSSSSNTTTNDTVVPMLPPAETLVGPCTSTSQGVCTDRAKFHVNLAKLGKTSWRDSAEQELLHLTPAQQHLVVVPNPLFLYDVEQLYDTNVTRRAQFGRDVQHFLGLTTPLPPLVPPVPSTRGPKPKALDVCQPQYQQTLRAPLVETGHRASRWILDYLLSDDHGQSKNVTVSCPDYFRTILEAWRKDPCDDERQT